LGRGPTSTRRTRTARHPSTSQTFRGAVLLSRSCSKSLLPPSLLYKLQHNLQASCDIHAVTGNRLNNQAMEPSGNIRKLPAKWLMVRLMFQLLSVSLQHPPLQPFNSLPPGPPPAYGQQPPPPPPTPCSVRVALLIGNDEYTGSARLSNCVHDAHDMAQTLQRMDFTVVKVFTNVSKSRFKEAVRWLLDQIRDGCIGVFFYSGHGCEMGGDNYLVPIGADVQRPADVEDEYIKLNWILKSLNGESTTSTFCIFLDCCRDNDEDMTWKSKLKGSAASRGLTDAGLAMKSPGGAAGASMSSFAIGFASNPGTVAMANSKGRNSRYTEALLRHLPTRQDLALLYRDVAADVEEATGNQQRPWLNVSLPRGYFIL